MKNWTEITVHSLAKPAVVMLVAAAAIFGGYSVTAPAIAAVQEFECKEGDVCRGKKSRLPLKVLPKTNASIYQEMDLTSAKVESNVAPFNPLLVFERHDIDYSDPIDPQGWFKVGREKNNPRGYMHASDVLEWRQAIILSYTHHGIGDDKRKPVLMFDRPGALKDVVLNSPDLGESYYEQLENGSAPDGVITRETDRFVDIKSKFYLLPVLDFEDLSEEFDEGQEVRILQIAAATRDGRIEKSQQCTTASASFNDCIAKQGKANQSDLKINVIYVVDTTTSMGPYIEAVANSIRESAQVFTKLKSGDSLKFGFVGYRDDVRVTPKLEYVVKNFTPDLLRHDDFNSLLGSGAIKETTEGSADVQEEVFAGVLEAINANWDDGATKVIVLIGDASSHELSHPKNTSGASVETVRAEADTKNAYIASLYIKRTDQEDDWPLGLQHFEKMARNPGGGKTFKAVDPDHASITNGLREATNIIVDTLGNIADVGEPQRVSTARNAAGQAVANTVRAAVVEWLGKETDPPSDIVAWVSDRDLTDIDRKSLRPHVLISRSDIDELIANLREIVAAYDGDAISQEGFFNTLRTMTTLASIDGNVSLASRLKDTPLVPRWMESLPYRSEIMSKTFQDFEDLTADERSQLSDRLRTMVSHYESVRDQAAAWIDLVGKGNEEDKVYPLPLDRLP